MTFPLSLVDFGLDRWRGVKDSVSVRDTFTRAEADQLMARGEKSGVKVRFWNVTRKYKIEEIMNLCPWPFGRASIASDLRVVPCCIIGNPDVSEVGIADEDFTYVWKGEMLTKFRQARLDGAIPRACASCCETRPQAIQRGTIS